MGKGHKDMCRILIGLIINLPPPGGQVPSRVVKAVWAILDFLYLAQFPSHTSDTLRRLNDSLTQFHQNKSVFVDLGVRRHFNIPKLHSLVHYQSSIALFGTTDNYNTEQSERLHIDFAKDAYRATNRKDEYPQMTTWLECREKVQQHSLMLNRKQRSVDHHNTVRTHAVRPIGPLCPRTRNLKMAINPSARAVSFSDIVRKYGATDFQDALADLIAQINYPDLTGNALRNLADNTLIPFHSVSVFHKIKFLSAASSNSDKFDVVDTIHVRAEQCDSRGRTIPPRFDTILVRGKGSSELSHWHPNNMHGSDGEYYLPSALD